jgi:hypothetical protein
MSARPSNMRTPLGWVRGSAKSGTEDFIGQRLTARTSTLPLELEKPGWWAPQRPPTRARPSRRGPNSSTSQHRS